MRRGVFMTGGNQKNIILWIGVSLFLGGCNSSFDVVTFGNSKIYLTVSNKGTSTSNIHILKEGESENYTIDFTLSRPLPVPTKIKLYHYSKGIPADRISYSGALPTDYGYELTIPAEAISGRFFVQMNARPGNTGLMGDWFLIDIEGNIEHPEFKTMMVAYEDSESGLTPSDANSNYADRRGYFTRALVSNPKFPVNRTKLKNSEFGFGLDSDGDLLLVGAPGYNNREGAVFVYKEDAVTRNFEFCTLIENPETGNRGEFGFSISILSKDLEKRVTSSGGKPNLNLVFAVGAPKVDESGAVFIYRDISIKDCDSGSISPTRKILPPVAKRVRRGNFGYALDFFVTANGKRALAVGMPNCGLWDLFLCIMDYNHQVIPWAVGSAFVFQENAQVSFFSNEGLLTITTIEPKDDAAFGMHFGASISARENLVLIGAPLYSPRTDPIHPPRIDPGQFRIETGALFAFNINGQPSLVGSDDGRIRIEELEAQTGWFGYDVDLTYSLGSKDRLRAVISAPRADLHIFEDAGRAFIYDFAPMQSLYQAEYIQDLYGLPAVHGVGFGSSVSISEDARFVGVGAMVYPGGGAYVPFYAASEKTYVSQELMIVAPEIHIPNDTLKNAPKGHAAVSPWLGFSIKAITRDASHCEDRIEYFSDAIAKMGDNAVPICADLMVPAPFADQEYENLKYISYGGMIQDQRVLDKNHWIFHTPD